MATAETSNPIDLVPDPSTIHRRIGELTRQRQLLRRLLRLALAAQQERRQAGLHPDCQVVASQTGGAA